jgi:hypothetical protein
VVAELVVLAELVAEEMAEEIILQLMELQTLAVALVER